MGFVATGQGRAFVAVALLEEGRLEWVISGPQGALPKGEPEVVLPNSATWRPGVRAVAIFSAASIEPAAAEKCAKGEECPASLERLELALKGAKAP